MGRKLKEVEYIDLEDDGLRLYLDSLKEPLNKEEKEKVYKMLLNNEDEARKILVERNLRLVIPIAKKYVHYGIDYLDLIQAGNIGLMKAAEKFDVNVGAEFSTYATYWIRQHIKRYAEDNSRTIRLANFRYGQMYEYKNAYNLLSSKLGREPSKHEIANELNISIDTLIKLERYFKDKISLNETIQGGNRSEDADDTEIIQLIPYEEESMEDVVEKSLMIKEVHNMLNSVRLNSQEIEVIKMRYGFDDGTFKTLKEVGKVLGMTRQRVQQIEQKAFGKIRRKYSDNELGKELKELIK